MNKEEVFKDELSLFKDDYVRCATLEMIKLLPDYFFKVPAASTGKYHPNYAQGEGGLVRHSKGAFRIAYSLLYENPVIGDKYTNLEKELMLMAILIHDGLKKGINEEKYTRFDHPILMANYVVDNIDKNGLKEEDAKFVAECIKTHMGAWTTDPYTKEEVLEKPKTKYQKFVHMCDYLGSRKFLEVPFDENNNISK